MSQTIRTPESRIRGSDAITRQHLSMYHRMSESQVAQRRCTARFRARQEFEFWLLRLPIDQPPPWRDMALSKAQRQAAWFAVHRPDRLLPQLRPDGGRVVAGELMVRVDSIGARCPDPALAFAHLDMNLSPDIIPHR